MAASAWLRLTASLPAQTPRLPRASASRAFVREGGSHTICRYGSQHVVIPRHREINEVTTRRILRDVGIT